MSSPVHEETSNHGEASVYFRSDELQGPPRLDLRLNPLDATQAESITYPKDDWYQYEVGFGLGGYILKDRLWFFASIMPRYTKTSRTVNFLLDGLDHTTAQRQNSYFGQVKLTVNPFSGLRVSASFTNDYYKWKGSLAQLDGTGNPDYQYDIYGYELPGWTAAARANFIVSDNLFFNLDSGYFRTNRKQLVEPEGPRYYFSRSNAGIKVFFGITAILAQIGSTSFIGSSRTQEFLPLPRPKGTITP